MTVRDEGLFELDMPVAEANKPLECVDQLSLIDVIPSKDLCPCYGMSSHPT